MDLSLFGPYREHAAFWIAWVLTNFSLSMLGLAWLCMLIEWPIHRKKLTCYEMIYRWVALLPLGFAGLYAAFMHAVYPDFTAQQIGWANSPFQFEVAMANLGFGLINVLAFRASYGFRLAAVIGTTCWLWGDAGGHIYQMMAHHNFAPGNAGSWFWMDILLPLIAIICMINMPDRSGKQVIAEAPIQHYE